jgi:hypothetical protein
MTDIEKLRELLAKATPGPWYYYEGEIEDGKQIEGADLRGNGASVWRIDMGDYDALDNANAALIVAVVNALPELLDEVERLRELDAARAELAEINVWTDDDQRGLTAAVADAMWHWDDMPMDCDDVISLTSIFKNSLRDNGFQIVRLAAALKGTDNE